MKLRQKNFSPGIGTTDPDFTLRFSEFSINNFLCLSRKIPIVLLLLWIFGGCFQNLPLSAQTMKTHHLADGTFKNNYLESIDKPFSKLLKWRWNRVAPEPVAFPMAENDPDFLKNLEVNLLSYGSATQLYCYSLKVSTF